MTMTLKITTDDTTILNKLSTIGYVHGLPNSPEDLPVQVVIEVVDAFIRAGYIDVWLQSILEYEEGISLNLELPDIGLTPTDDDYVALLAELDHIASPVVYKEEIEIPDDTDPDGDFY